MIKTNKKANLIVSGLLAVVATLVVANTSAKTAFADCEQNYGGGENCTYTRRLRIHKWVKLDGDNTWKDEVVIDLNDGNENDKKILFKVEVTADISDASGVDKSKIEFDDMKMKDKWPSELKFLEDQSESDLTEEWDNFKPGETKTFYYAAKIQGSEKNRVGDFQKCVVNKASLYYKNDNQGSADAVVCYKKVTDVLGTSTSRSPETGALPVSGIVGFSLMSLGTVLRKYKKS
jgi:hypothetical protein